MGTTSEILEELKQWQSPLADAPRSMPYEVPDNYFSDLAGNIIAGIHAEEKPLQWSDRTPFATPENYFDTLPQDILAKVKKADVLDRPKKRSIAFTVFIRSAAAILLIAIGILGYQYFKQDATTQQQLAAISNDDISSYLVQHVDEFDMDLVANNLSSADLSELENIGNEDIIDYLDETGWNVDANIN